MVAMPAATATALPLDEPPGTVCGIPGIARHTPERRIAIGRFAEFGHGGAGDYDGAGLQQATSVAGSVCFAPI